MVICYVAIYFKVRKVRKELENCFGNIESIYKEEDLQLLKMIGIIFSAFLFCITPLFIMNLFITDSVFLIVILNGLFVTNFVINPFIYGFKNKLYRPAFINLYQKMCKFLCNIIAFLPCRSSEPL